MVCNKFQPRARHFHRYAPSRMLCDGFQKWRDRLIADAMRPNSLAGDVLQIEMKKAYGELPQRGVSTWLRCPGSAQYDSVRASREADGLSTNNQRRSTDQLSRSPSCSHGQPLRRESTSGNGGQISTPPTVQQSVSGQNQR